MIESPPILDERVAQLKAWIESKMRETTATGRAEERKQNRIHLQKNIEELIFFNNSNLEQEE